jgi:hypothetical protein
MNYNIPKFPYNIPFWMFDISNKQLITTTTIPGDIVDKKDIFYSEVPIPGMNFQPVMIGGGGNRKLNFTLPLIKRNNTIGNLLILKQFDMLRNQNMGLTQMFSGQFRGFPKVLFMYGTGSIPLLYFVKNCSFTHKTGMINELGFPQYSEIEFELWLDENSILYKGEEIFRKITSISGMVVGLVDVIQSQTSQKKNPY